MMPQIQELSEKAASSSNFVGGELSDFVQVETIRSISLGRRKGSGDDSYRQVRICAFTPVWRDICFRGYQEILSISSRNRLSFATNSSAQRVLPPPCSWCGPEPLGILRLMVSSRLAQRCRNCIGLLGDRERKARISRVALETLLNLGVNDERLDILIEMLPEHVDYGRRNIPNITKEAMRRVRGTGVGYYTFRFNHTVRKCGRRVFLPT